MSRLLHYTENPLEFDSHRVYDQDEQRGGYLKPKGLWVSVEGDDDWLSWCQDEGFGKDRLVNVTEVVLHPDANLNWIVSGAQLEAFNEEYFIEKYSLPVPVSHRFSRIGGIDWGRVASEWDGVVIAPYRWSYRLDPQFHWYYGWDCASGCIWNMDAISSVIPANKVLST